MDSAMTTCLVVPWMNRRPRWRRRRPPGARRAPARGGWRHHAQDQAGVRSPGTGWRSCPDSSPGTGRPRAGVGQCDPVLRVGLGADRIVHRPARQVGEDDASHIPVAVLHAGADVSATSDTSTCSFAARGDVGVRLPAGAPGGAATRFLPQAASEVPDRLGGQTPGRRQDGPQVPAVRVRVGLPHNPCPAAGWATEMSHLAASPGCHHRAGSARSPVRPAPWTPSPEPSADPVPGS